MAPKIPSDGSVACSRSWSRRDFLVAGAGLCASAWASSAWASTAVPAARQAELLAKAGKYDRNMKARVVEGQLRVLFVSKTDSVESREFVLLASRRLAELGRVGDLPLDIRDKEVDSALEVGPELDASPSAIVVLSTGLRSQISPLADELRGRSVLTVAASPEYVALGAVLGFDLVNGSPSLLVNLPRARAQSVDFHASFLKLAKIVE